MGKWPEFIAFFILGTINNLAYVVVGSASRSLADMFNMASYLGVITWANVLLGLIVRSANTWLLAKTSYYLRMSMATAAAVLGLLGVAFSVYVDFWFMIASVVVLGASSSFGESVLLGYTRSSDAEASIGGWSSGTGMAGVLGTSLYLLFASGFGLSNEVIFLILEAFVVVYFVTFIVYAKKKDKEKGAYKPLIPPTESSEEESQEEPEEVKQAENDKKESMWKRTKRCFVMCRSQAVQLALVYFFEYAISTGCAQLSNVDCVNIPDDTCLNFSICTLSNQSSSDSNTNCTFITGDLSPSVFASVNAFEILAWCYQFGVLLSRSSLKVVKIRRVWILTLLQAINFAVWMGQSWLRFIPSVWIQFALMVFVGLLGGAMYVNVFYNIMSGRIGPVHSSSPSSSSLCARKRGGGKGEDMIVSDGKHGQEEVEGEEREGDALYDAVSINESTSLLSAGHTSSGEGERGGEGKGREGGRKGRKGMKKGVERSHTHAKEEENGVEEDKSEGEDGRGQCDNSRYSSANDKGEVVEISQSDKELMANITALSITIGITTAALFVLLMDNTFLHYRISS
uniref:Battenin n=1 Tax=Palpitomonas bilix TaxID=652834 RepID=A0A7S3G326_9EUKA|mmetsp:Transcript_15078/g.38111  ORF Transcript_15078/g.38111 Transcript_15078/m.38111 type:complete len:570 (+) Transcript_15078:132-1841(+)